MSMGERRALTTDRLQSLRTWARSDLSLARSGALALGAAVAAVATAALVFTAMLQDVLSRDGMTLRDSSIDKAIADHRTPGLVDAAKVLTNVGGIGVLVVLAVAVAGVLWLSRLKLAEVAAPFVSLGVAASCAAVLKTLVARSRPDVPIRLMNETEPSFPSGHATDTTALFVSIAIVLAVVVFRRPVIRALMLLVGFAVPAVIGLTRLELGVHWPSDVIAGWALGTMAAVAVTSVLILVARLADSARPDRGGPGWRVVRVLGYRRPHRSDRPAALASIGTLPVRSLSP